MVPGVVWCADSLPVPHVGLGVVVEEVEVLLVVGVQRQDHPVPHPLRHRVVRRLRPRTVQQLDLQGVGGVTGWS
jgi:hypothetical protein